MVAWPAASSVTFALLVPELLRLPPVAVMVTEPMAGCPCPSVTVTVMCARLPSLLREDTSEVTERLPAEPPEVVPLQATTSAAAARTRSLRSRFTKPSGAPLRRGPIRYRGRTWEGQFFNESQ